MITTTRKSRQLHILCAVIGATISVPALHALAGPDVIVGDLQGVKSFGSVGDIAAFSIGTTSCNIGDVRLDWIWNNNRHPVIGQNMFRHKDGRFEQIGMGWLKHGFFALSQSLCSTCLDSTNGSRLGVGCSDPYTASLNGSQTGLGPRFEVNANTGDFLYPFTGDGTVGDAIFKRVQVHHADLDPAANVGARYFVDGHYVTPDDAAVGNQDNNASHREIAVFPNGASYTIAFASGAFTRRTEPAINAWGSLEPGVVTQTVQLLGEGQFRLAYNVTDNGNNTWHYEYALYNLNSDLSAGSFTVPAPSGLAITNVGFHDVDYHSGEPFDGTDWAATNTGGELTWSTAETFAQNPDANALRWGTLYNFRFDADTPPETTTASIGMFKPGGPSQVNVSIQGPSALPQIEVPPGATVFLAPGNPPCDPATTCSPLDHALIAVTNTCGVSGTVAAEVVNTDLHVGASGFRTLGDTFVLDTDLGDGCLKATIAMPFTLSEALNAEDNEGALIWFDGTRWVPAVCGNTSPPASGCSGDSFDFNVQSSPSTSVPTLTELHAPLPGSTGLFLEPVSGRGFAWAAIDHASDFAVGLPPPPVPAVSQWGAFLLSLCVLTTATVMIRRRETAG